ncbi:ring-cleaving dioxygenase [Desulfomonile tiedjei]|uniref:Lactoylglutathione lyase-like lyase n=1 Tax=Desulfomonile tiedjei (strain ATCC 49306 / DSM 6799 / DCB-1) TaxID=706587 RepID=I4C0K6_DESTA|nr:ring-cleaving dioxygenase [Desulfomonile tiedjei]AFM23097.1 lactoylglutathione lyase-like lyase [Desulfomonile tiedjei DSM 6799]
METPLKGLHHVTAIAGDPQRNLDFYATVLGLRLVKLTVNFDDPGTYHFYFGDDEGRPGTLLTFFPWPLGTRGRIGPGQIGEIAFSIDYTATEYWIDRLRKKNVPVEGPFDHFGRETLRFHDPDGLILNLVSSDHSERDDNAILGLHSVTFVEKDPDRTGCFISDLLGFPEIESQGSDLSFDVGLGQRIHVVAHHSQERGLVAVGTVHHVAVRVPDNASQRAWHKYLAGSVSITPIIDRKYFKSIYFREPGGILMEVATDPPGFAVDESRKTLGTRLMLPEDLEAHRSSIEQNLPSITLPRIVRAA